MRLIVLAGKEMSDENNGHEELGVVLA